MGFFDFLKSKPKKNKYETYHDSISEIINLLNRKKEMIDKGVLVDLEFDKLMFERFKLFEILKGGSISFLGKDLCQGLINVFDEQEINKNNFMTIWKYLENEQLKLKNLF